MTKHFQYLSYVARHKWFVFLAGLKTDAPLGRLIIHDWSKLSLVEWIPYVNKFYGDEHLDQDRVEADFDRAWLHHQHKNPHHWQHWVLRKDDGGTKVIEMPESFVREMVADWMGAGRAITGKWEAKSWYEKNRDKIILHSQTRKLVEFLLDVHG